MHNFIRKESPHNKYMFTIHCTRCGYVSFYGNNEAETNQAYQDNIPKTCTEKSEVIHIPDTPGLKDKYEITC